MQLLLSFHVHVCYMCRIDLSWLSTSDFLNKLYGLCRIQIYLSFIVICIGELQLKSNTAVTHCQAIALSYMCHTLAKANKPLTNLFWQDST